MRRQSWERAETTLFLPTPHNNVTRTRTCHSHFTNPQSTIIFQETDVRSTVHTPSVFSFHNTLSIILKKYDLNLNSWKRIEYDKMNSLRAFLIQERHQSWHVSAELFMNKCRIPLIPLVIRTHKRDNFWAPEGGVVRNKS